MSRADVQGLWLIAVVSLSAVASAAPERADAPVQGRAPRSARLLAEGVTVGVAGVLLPVGTYVAFTAGLQSFVGFFAGFLGATVLGAVVAPLALIIVGHLLGADGGTGRAVVGALIGLVVGLLIGLPLATIPGAAYVVGLGLAWVMPSVGALIAFEWGRPTQDQAAGLVLARF